MSAEDYRTIRDQIEQNMGQKLNEAEFQQVIAEICRNRPFFDTSKKQMAVNLGGQIYTSNEEMCANQ